MRTIISIRLTTLKLELKLKLKDNLKKLSKFKNKSRRLEKDLKILEARSVFRKKAALAFKICRAF